MASTQARADTTHPAAALVMLEALENASRHIADDGLAGRRVAPHSSRAMTTEK
jgi:hypothetical protein